MVSFGGSLLLRRRPGVPLRVPRQPDQDAAGTEGAPRRAVPRHGAGGRATRTVGDPLLDATTCRPTSRKRSRRIRTNVLFSSADEGMRSLVVTSAGPGEGKSIVSSNLAIALAQAGQRVLLIDADMRRPRVHEIFGGNQEPGLSNVLTGNAKASRRHPQARRLHGLWLLSSGHIPPNPAELLGSRRFAGFHDLARRALRLGDHRHAAGARRRRQLDRRQPGVRRGVRGGRRQDQPARRARRRRAARCGERAHRRLGAEPRGPRAAIRTTTRRTTARSTRSTT